MTTRNLNAIDTNFYGVRFIYSNGVELDQYPSLNFVNATVTEDTVNNRIDIEVADPLVASATPNAEPNTIAKRNSGAGCAFLGLTCSNLVASSSVTTVDLTVTGSFSVVNLTASGTIIADDIQTNTLTASGATSVGSLDSDGDVNVFGNFTVSGTTDLLAVTAAGIHCELLNCSSSYHRTAQVTFALGNTLPGLIQEQANSDTATKRMDIQTQLPYASATGTNRKAGDLRINFGQPSNGGTGFALEGKCIFARQASDKMKFGWDTANSAFRMEAQTTLHIASIDDATFSTALLQMKTGNASNIGTSSGPIIRTTGTGPITGGITDITGNASAGFAGNIWFRIGSSAVYPGGHIALDLTNNDLHLGGSGNVFMNCAPSNLNALGQRNVVWEKSIANPFGSVNNTKYGIMYSHSVTGLPRWRQPGQLGADLPMT